MRLGSTTIGTRDVDRHPSSGTITCDTAQQSAQPIAHFLHSHPPLPLCRSPLDKANRTHHISRPGPLLGSVIHQRGNEHSVRFSKYHSQHSGIRNVGHQNSRPASCQCVSTPSIPVGRLMAKCRVGLKYHHSLLIHIKHSRFVHSRRHHTHPRCRFSRTITPRERMPLPSEQLSTYERPPNGLFASSTSHSLNAMEGLLL